MVVDTNNEAACTLFQKGAVGVLIFFIGFILILFVVPNPGFQLNEKNKGSVSGEKQDQDDCKGFHNVCNALVTKGKKLSLQF